MPNVQAINRFLVATGLDIHPLVCALLKKGPTAVVKEEHLRELARVIGKHQRDEETPYQWKALSSGERAALKFVCFAADYPVVSVRSSDLYAMDRRWRIAVAQLLADCTVPG